MAQQEDKQSRFHSSKVIKKKRTAVWKLPFNALIGTFDFVFEQLNLNIKRGSSGVSTIKEIMIGIDLKGYNLWMLLLSAFLASIGLNTNSPAIIIGAMLISPLMNPILGMGLGFGIDDPAILFRAIKNLLIAITVSLGISALYFFLTPIKDLTPEISGRTYPTLLDVGVAFFGGLAGIITSSRAKGSNALPGVAIATALMPPLCSAGYGLAHANWAVFGGAFYLFSLNAIFISLSTFLIVKYLRFDDEKIVAKAKQEIKEEIAKMKRNEKIRKAEEQQLRNSSQGAIQESIPKRSLGFKFLRFLMPLFLVVSIAPSVYFFWTLIKKNQDKAGITEIIKDKLGKEFLNIEFKDKVGQKGYLILVHTQNGLINTQKNELIANIKEAYEEYKIDITNIAGREMKQNISEDKTKILNLELEMEKLKLEIQKLKLK